MSLRDYKFEALLSVQGKDGCQDPRCSRVNGECRGYHCANCGKPSSYQGHYALLLKTGEHGFLCAPEEPAA